MNRFQTLSHFGFNFNLRPYTGGYDPVDVATAVKAYLRSLPEPLLTFSLYTAVVQSGEAGLRLPAVTNIRPSLFSSSLELAASH